MKKTMYIQPNVEVVALQGGYLCQQGSSLVNPNPLDGGSEEDPTYGD